MESIETKALLRASQQRFHSFSEAAETVIGALAGAVPGTLFLAQVEPEEQVCRVLDVKGAELEGVRKGALLPLGPPANGSGHPSSSGPPPEIEPDWELLSSLGAQSCLGVPLATSDGRILGNLTAVDVRRGAYGCRDVAMLSVAAQLLSHEWEGVERRAELRRLRGRLTESPEFDHETGLLARDGFLELLDREWRLAQRGNVESVLVTFRVGAGTGQSADPASKLALKTTAEVLAGSARTTDRVGRTGEAGLAAILTGCRPDQTPVFVERFLAAVQRVTNGNNLRIELTHGSAALAGAPSAAEALERAEAEAAAVRGEPQAEPRLEVHP